MLALLLPRKLLCSQDQIHLLNFACQPHPANNSHQFSNLPYACNFSGIDKIEVGEKLKKRHSRKAAPLVFQERGIDKEITIVLSRFCSLPLYFLDFAVF
jgi:hypothetical protein